MQCIAVFCGVVALAAGGAVNYCGARMCANTNAHTFCQFPEGPSPHCEGYISARLTIEEKSRLIARLNRRRNEAASGIMRGLPTAGNMLKLRWVEELAREAQRWADQCRPPRPIEEHDACRNLYSLTVGQCVASVVGEAPGLKVESMVDIWYMQSMLFKGNVTFYVPPTPNGSFYGDFAQIIWARSYMVGCGRSRFMTQWQGRLRSVERLVCNIAPAGPIPSRPLWAPAAPAALCPPRSIQDHMLKALCDYRWDPDDLSAIGSSMTLEEHLLLNTVLEIEDNQTLNYLGSLDEIYLTKMAIATLENIITTQVNSMQRRDVVEVIDMDSLYVNISSTTIAPTAMVPPMATVPPTATVPPMILPTSPLTTPPTLPPPVVVPATNTTLPPDKNTTTTKVTKITKKKISLIGRPRTYNMEDLTDFDEKTENNTPIEEKEIPKREKEFYAEYDFLEIADDNVSSTITTTTITTTMSTIDLTNTTEAQSIVNVLINPDVLRDAVTRLSQNSNVLYGGPLNTLITNDLLKSDMPSLYISNIGNESNTGNEINTGNWSQGLVVGNATFTTRDDIDDYLSDPETVRELQEALERIEQDMAPKRQKSEKQGKVRRELRNFPEDSESTTQIDGQSSNGQYDAEERNKTLERGPMYNMVMKYMPYLKQYEGGILPKDGEYGSSIASGLSPSLFLVLIVCL
ncbi:hypothetical protein B5X24_HaOG205135 [Helicoverpa armigera]|uniref:SCP domain-containing protein n=1 Tax=Helicoverpa armigera TaxID=29058 RepID=A0A2W1BPA2_HELAM|nr:hypothetical protein B5X24_HaOG205135 [Helicoverpa armigera]